MQPGDYRKFVPARIPLSWKTDVVETWLGHLIDHLSNVLTAKPGGVWIQTVIESHQERSRYKKVMGISLLPRPGWGMALFCAKQLAIGFGLPNGDTIEATLVLDQDEMMQVSLGYRPRPIQGSYVFCDNPQPPPEPRPYPIDLLEVVETLRHAGLVTEVLPLHYTNGFHVWCPKRSIPARLLRLSKWPGALRGIAGGDVELTGISGEAGGYEVTARLLDFETQHQVALVRLRGQSQEECFEVSSWDTDDPILASTLGFCFSRPSDPTSQIRSLAESIRHSISSGHPCDRVQYWQVNDIAVLDAQRRHDKARILLASIERRWRTIGFATKDLDLEQELMDVLEQFGFSATHKDQ